MDRVQQHGPTLRAQRQTTFPAVLRPLPAGGVDERLTPVYAFLACRSIPRDVLVTPWRLLHLLEYCNLRASLHRPSVQPSCTHPACSAAATVDTLTHRFLECPVVAPVWNWVRRVFAAAAGVPDFDFDSDDVLLNKLALTSAFPAALQSLWQCLRCASLHSISVLARRRDTAAIGFAASVVMEDVISVVVAAMRTDAFLLRNAGTPLLEPCGALDAPCLSLEEFRDKWGRDGVLYRSAGSSVRILFAFHHPFNVDV